MADIALPESDAEETGDKDEREPASQKMAEVHERAMLRFDSISMPQAELRAQSLLARRFVTIPGAMWEDAWGELFDNSPRPEVDKITPGLEKIEGDYRENRMTVDFIPAGGSGDDVTADTLDGMHRADSYQFKAQQARDNAFMEAIRGGFGAYRLSEEYEDPLDPDNDNLRVIPAMTIVDADQSVYFDGGSKLYDKSDAQWAFVVTAEPRRAAEDKWGEGIAPWPINQFRYQYDWFRPDTVRIAEYYEVETTNDVRIVLTQEQSGEEQRFFESDVEAKDIRDLVAQGWKKKTRKVERKRVRKYIMTGERVLKDCGYIAGEMIPIVPVYGKRVYVDNMERWYGYVGKFMDRQRIYNSRVARLMETASLAPREVPIVAAEQVDATIADEWARANIDRHPFLRLHPLRNEAGEIVSAGPIGKLSPPEVPQVEAALLQLAAGDLAENNDNADQVKANVSADAMDIAASRVDAKSAIYLDNMRQSVQREGEIYLSKARDCYWQPGRKVETLSMDGKDDLATLGEPRLGQDGVYRLVNDLQRGSYKVVADVQEATSTRQQKTVRQCLAAAEVAIQAQQMDIAGAYIITAGLNQEGEGMENLHDWLHQKALQLGLVKPSPEEQQAMQQQQQNAQPSAADQALQAKAAESQSKAMLNQASAQEKQASAQLKEAQASAVGGPDSAPDTPSGLSSPANDTAETAVKFASADLKSAQAAHLRHDMGLRRLKTGAEIADMHHQQMMDRLKQSTGQAA